MSVGYDDVQRVCLKGAVTMATPATVVGDVRDAAHLALNRNKLQRIPGLGCLDLLGISRDLGDYFWPLNS